MRANHDHSPRDWKFLVFYYGDISHEVIRDLNERH